ncbi:MAG: hypothetical protein JW864_09585 [Spirochaetes bacterium]|nr:hypothetical protein [Spirochaetota bacterium]
MKQRRVQNLPDPKGGRRPIGVPLRKVLVIFGDGKANSVRVTPRWCIHQSEMIKRIFTSIAKLTR